MGATKKEASALLAPGQKDYTARMSELTPPVVVLDKSQMADNIGAVARVMANFGLSELRLVSPRDGWPQERAWATASGAD